MAFESNRLGVSQLWVANADGTNQRRLDEGGKGVQGSPRWSRDGQSIVYDGQGPDGQQSIYVLAAEGGQPRLLTSPGNTPSWSHDGRWVYFSRDGYVWRVTASGTSAERITDDRGSNPLESPDGSTLYFRRSSVPGVRYALYAKPVGGGPERKILDGMSWIVHQFVPMDDGVYYVTCPDPRRPRSTEIRFHAFATGEHRTLHVFEARSTSGGLTVSPDRRTILYAGTTPADGPDLKMIRNFK